MAEDSDANLPYYLVRNENFGVARPEDDLLHPEKNAAIEHRNTFGDAIFQLLHPRGTHSFLHVSLASPEPGCR